MKTLTILVIAVIVIGGAYVVFKGTKTAEAPTDDVTSEALVPATDEAVAPEMVVELEEIISYTDSGYSPASLIVRVGDMVTFKNNSAKSMWPASAQHPTHNAYPTAGGCLGSTFDACKGVPPGGSWSFKFDFKGDWKYHDHLAPQYSGTVVVE